MQWPAITGGWEFVAEEDQSPLWDDSPAEGHLPSSVAARLAGVLRRHTGTPDDCWFGVWQGWGGALSTTTLLRLPAREHLLVRGPVELAAANMAAEPSEQSANLWWPADRAWCVATDVDLMSTYVGGSAACLAELAAIPELEVLPATPDEPVTYAADRFNPVPERE
jgi:pimeloyl-ACP methyl ester carboxylesterase